MQALCSQWSGPRGSTFVILLTLSCPFLHIFWNNNEIWRKSHDCTQTHPKHPGTLWLPLPAQTCAGMLSCVHMYTQHLQAGRLPLQEKLRSAVCPSVSPWEVFKWTVNPLDNPSFWQLYVLCAGGWHSAKCLPSLADETFLTQGKVEMIKVYLRKAYTFALMMWAQKPTITGPSFSEGVFLYTSGFCSHWCLSWCHHDMLSNASSCFHLLLSMEGCRNQESFMTIFCRWWIINKRSVLHWQVSLSLETVQCKAVQSRKFKRLFSHMVYGFD